MPRMHSLSERIGPGLPRCVAALLCLLLLSLVGCADGESTAEDGGGEQAVAAEPAAPDAVTESGAADEEDEPDKPRKERATSVTAAAALRGELVIPVMAEGKVRARHAADLKFDIAGRITHLWVQEGQRVRKGQKLARLDDREYKLALEEADFRYLKALGQLAVEENGYRSDGAERLLEVRRAELDELEGRGAISHRERLDRELELGMDAVREGAYRRELLEVRSGLASARADAARLRLDLERTLLRAPFDGVVTGLDHTTGVRVQAGETLCRLVDDVHVEAEVGVLESDLAAIAPGRPALLTLPALGETLPVRVDVVSPDIDASSRTCRVLMRLESEDGRIKPGMFVRAAIAGRVYPDRLLVPRQAIVTRDGRPVLFKVDSDRARWVYVSLGERNDQLVEIARVLQGGPLEPGTLVVVDNHLTLTHDAKVRVKKKLVASDPWVVAGEQG